MPTLLRAISYGVGGFTMLIVGYLYGPVKVLGVVTPTRLASSPVTAKRFPLINTLLLTTGLILRCPGWHGAGTVSYTHLTLPTKLEV